MIPGETRLLPVYQLEKQHPMFIPRILNKYKTRRRGILVLRTCLFKKRQTRADDDIASQLRDKKSALATVAGIPAFEVEVFVMPRCSEWIDGRCKVETKIKQKKTLPTDAPGNATRQGCFAVWRPSSLSQFFWIHICRRCRKISPAPHLHTHKQYKGMHGKKTARPNN